MSLIRRRWPSWEYSLEIRLRPGGWARRGDIAATATTATLGGRVENHDPLTNTRGGADRCARPEGAAHPGLGGSERGRPEGDLLIAYVVAGAAESTAKRPGLCHRRRWIIDRSAVHVTTQQNVDSLSKIRNKQWTSCDVCQKKKKKENREKNDPSQYGSSRNDHVEDHATNKRTEETLIEMERDRKMMNVGNFNGKTKQDRRSNKVYLRTANEIVSMITNETSIVERGVWCE